MADGFASFGNGSTIGEHVKIIHPEKIHIGDNVTIDDLCLLDATYGKGIWLEDNSVLDRGAILHASGFEYPDGYIILRKKSKAGIYNVLAGHAGLEIGEGTRISPMVSLNGYKHLFEERELGICEQGSSANPVMVGADVYIATGAIVLGVIIGHGAVIAAGSVVVDNVPEYAIVAGVPAVVKGYRH